MGVLQKAGSRESGLRFSSVLSRELSAGFVSGIAALTNCFAYGALVFSGPLHPFLGQGIAASLTSCAIISLVMAARSQFPTAIVSPVAASSAVLANLMSSLAPAMQQLGADERLALAYAALFVTTVSTGLVLVAFGVYKATRFVRYIPYPVISGFMAATGWLIAAGAVNMGADVSLNAHTISRLQTREDILLLLLFGWTALLWALTSRVKHPLALPVALVGASAAVDFALPLAGINDAQALTHGLYFAVPDPNWPGVPALSGVYLAAPWKQLLSSGDAFGAVIIIGTLQALLTANGLELGGNKEIDLDREMRTVGVANALSAAFGGFIAQIAVSTTAMNRAAGGKTRLTGLVVALLAIVSIFGGARVLEYVPRFILAGALLLQGLRLLQQWIGESLRSMPRPEWLLVIGMVILTAWFGFIPAEIAGLLAACVVFVVNVSRIQTVRAVSGLLGSTVVRTEEEMRYLAEHGQRVRVFDLRGYIFFGSAYRVRQRVEVEISEHSPALVIFDFSKVIGIDSSAASALVGVARLLEEHSVEAIIVGMSGASQKTLKNAGALRSSVRHVSDIDEALEEGERIILAGLQQTAGPAPTFSCWLNGLLGPGNSWEVLRDCLIRREIQKGEFLCRQHETSDDLYLIESGRLSAMVDRVGSSPMRVRAFGARTMVGEVAFILKVPRSAGLRADEHSVVWELPRSALDKLLKGNPELVMRLFEQMLRVQVERLSFATQRIAALRVSHE